MLPLSSGHGTLKTREDHTPLLIRFLFLFLIPLAAAPLSAKEVMEWSYVDAPFDNNLDWKTPKAINSSLGWTSQEIENLGLTPLQATKLLPSLQVQGSEFAGPPSTVFLRGSPSDEVLLLWNGLELNDPASAGGGGSPMQTQREFSHLLRVTRGPSTLIDGPRALAGVLRWTRSPAVPSRLVLSGGSLENQSGLLELQKQRGKESAAWGFGLGQTRNQGLSVSSASQGFEKDTQSFSSGSFFWDWPIDPSLRLELVGMASRLDQDDDLFGSQDKDARSTQQMQAGRVAIHQSLSSKDAVSLETQMVQSRRENRNDPIADILGYLDFSEGDRTKTSLTWSRQSLVSNVDLNFRVETLEEGLAGTSEGGGPFTRFHQRQVTQGVAMVLTSRDKLSQGGLRLDRMDTSSQSHEQALSWQVLLRGTPFFAGVSPFFSLAEAFRFPTLYHRFSKYGDPEIKTQALHAFELGLEAQPNEVTTWSLGAFRNDYSRMIDYDFVSDRFENRGATRIQGVEADFSQETMAHRWQVGVTYLWAQDLNLEQRLLRRPNFAGSLLWNYHLSQLWETTWTLRWLDSRIDQVTSTQTASLPPSWQSDFILQYQSMPKLKWNFSLKNIFNSGSEEVFGYSVVPRSFYVTLEMPLEI